MGLCSISLSRLSFHLMKLFFIESSYHYFLWSISAIELQIPFSSGFPASWRSWEPETHWKYWENWLSTRAVESLRIEARIIWSICRHCDRKDLQATESFLTINSRFRARGFLWGRNLPLTPAFRCDSVASKLNAMSFLTVSRESNRPSPILNIDFQESELERVWGLGGAEQMQCRCRLKVQSC